MHTKFGVIWTYDDKVMLRTRKAGRGHGRGHGRRRPKYYLYVAFSGYTNISFKMLSIHDVYINVIAFLLIAHIIK